MELVRYSDSSEWTALYVDGKLDRVGDAYLIDERIAQLSNVEEREGDFTCGTNIREGVPSTLNELENYLTETNLANLDAAKVAKLQEIQKLEAKAEELRQTL